MALPWWANQLEDELGVVKDPAKGAENYMWVLTRQAITVDSRLYFRAKLASGGFYWKTWTCSPVSCRPTSRRSTTPTLRA